MKVLIVDDEPVARLVLSRILARDFGCSVSEACNGLDALTLLSRHDFDFVVMDVVMPVMDGTTALEAMRRTPSLRHLPVVVLSAVRDEAQVRLLVSLGISAYLTKPLRPADVTARLAAFLQQLDATPAVEQTPVRTMTGLPRGARVLAVDSDTGFLHLVRTALGPHYAVSVADGCGQGLRACMDQRPGAILLGQHLGPVQADMFIRKLRALPSLSDIPVITVVSRREDGRGHADAALVRTPLPDVFARQFERLVAGGSPQERALSDRAELRPQMISATEQVFGMMLGLEVSALVGAPVPPVEGDDLARVTLSLSEESVDLHFVLVADRRMSERMTMLFLRAGDVVTEDDIAATLREVVSIIAGRLQNALRQRGDAVTCSVSAAGRYTPEAAADDAGIRVAFASAVDDLRFTVSLCAVVPHAVVPQAVVAQTAASEAGPGDQPVRESECA